jgi:hypothetical protein
MTPSQKRLKTLILSYLDRLIAYVEEIKDSIAPTSLDHVLKLQRQRVHNTTDADVLLQVSDGDQLAKYLKHVDDLEDSVDGDDPALEKEIARKGEILDEYLERVGNDIDALRAKVEEEVEEHSVAASTGFNSGNAFLDAVAERLEATGAEVSIVTALFKKKSFSQLLAARKKRRRWLRTPGGKAAIRRERIRAKRPHMIDRKRVKTSHLAHQVYKQDYKHPHHY